MRSHTINLNNIGKNILIGGIFAGIAILGSYNSKFYFVALSIVFGYLLIFHPKVNFYILIFLAGAYMVFDYGITNLGFKFGGGLIPIPELLIIVGLIRILINSKYNSIEFSIDRKYSFPFFLIFLFYIIRIPFDIHKYGIIAIRDGLHYIEMLLFIIVTYELNILKREKINIEAMCKKFIIISLNILFLYSLFYVKRDFLLNISPTYSGYQQVFTLIGYFGYTTYWVIVLIMINLYFIHTTNIDKKLKMLLHIQNTIAVSIILLSTSRITIITYVALIFMTLFMRRYRIARSMVGYFAFIGIAFCILLLLGVKIQSYRGTVDLNLVKEIALSCFGIGDSNMATGFNQRTEWLGSIIENIKSPKSFFIGLGFGQALTNFIVGDGIKVREPHNSFISISSRMGIFIFFLWIINLMRILKKNISRYLSENSFWNYLSMIIIIAAALNCLVEPFFESAQTLVAFYTILGIANFDGFERRGG